jgi:hypothetical protein
VVRRAANRGDPNHRLVARTGQQHAAGVDEAAPLLGEARHRIRRLDCARRRDGAGGGARSAGEIPSVGARGGDLGHAVARVEHRRGLDDARHRTVRRGQPGGAVERRGRRRDLVPCPAKQRAERRVAAAQDLGGIGRQQPGLSRRFEGRVAGDRHGQDQMAVAAGVEVAQLKRVVLGLCHRSRAQRAGLELQRQDRAVGQHHRVRALLEAQPVVFERDGPGLAAGLGDRIAQRRRLSLPGEFLVRAARIAARLLRRG